MTSAAQIPAVDRVNLAYRILIANVLTEAGLQTGRRVTDLWVRFWLAQDEGEAEQARAARDLTGALLADGWTSSAMTQAYLRVALLEARAVGSDTAAGLRGLERRAEILIRLLATFETARLEAAAPSAKDASTVLAAIDTMTRSVQDLAAHIDTVGSGRKGP